MMDDPRRLLDRYLLGRLRAEEIAGLRDWLKSDPANIRDFVIETYLSRGIHEILMSERLRAQGEGPSRLDDLFWEIAEKQRTKESGSGEEKDRTAPGEVTKDVNLRSLLEDVVSPEERARVVEMYAKRQLEVFLAEQEELARQQHREEHVPSFFPGPWQVAAAIVTLLRMTYRARRGILTFLVMGLMLVAGRHYMLARRVVATLGDSRSARWAIPPQESVLRRGHLRLEEGSAQIKFTSGAEVILQAPCAFDLRSPRAVFLESGALAVKIVSAGARGFTVQTPDSQVVDFGTEFGVLAGERGGSEVHVFKGRVRLRATHADKQKGRLRELVEGWSARIDEQGVIAAARVQEGLFCRSLPDANSFGIPGRRLDLADILGGGNGFGTGQMEHGLDPLTGRFTGFDAQNYTKKGTGHYMRVEGNSFVDGVFIPDGKGDRPVVISSQGHLFGGCPKTNGQVDGEIQNTHRRILFHSGDMSCRPRLGDRVFDTAAHPHIYMQANVGITFDLEALRSHLTSRSVRRFMAECGVCAEVPRDEEQVDFWVLVDGQVRFSHLNATRAQGAVKIDVPLYEQDRFLTLVVTEGSDDSLQDSGWDLGLFAEPALELGPKRTMPE